MLLDSLRNSGILNVNENSKVFSTPVGFTSIDLLGATIEMDMNGVEYLNRGVAPKFYMNTGESGLGKSTMQIQAKCYAVEWWNRKFPETEPSDLIIFDSEDFTTSNRVMDLSHWSPDYMNRHLSLRKDTDLTNIYNLILKIADMKAKNKSVYYVDTGMRDVNGKMLKTWVPTFIIIDSLAAIKAGAGLENVEKDKSGELKEMAISQNIDAMREAKDNTNFIMKVKPLCNEYGINISIINHITKDNQMSMFDVPKRYLITLKPGEKLRGGYELIYQAYGIDRLTLKERLTPDRNPVYGEGIDGAIVEYTYLKSKNHGEGLPYRMVMDKREGYKPELSDFEYLYTQNYGFQGAGVGISLTILPEIKFSRKNLEEKCRAHPELARALQFTAKMHIVHTLLLDKKEGPSLDFLAEMDYDKRIAYIFSYTTRYPGYGTESLSEELQRAYTNGRAYVSTDMTLDLSQSYMSPMDIFIATAQSELSPACIPIKSERNFVFPQDDPASCIIAGNLIGKW